MVASGFAFLWFSAFDNMDGLRARRLKNGSPLGRVIDEGLDPVAYLHAVNVLLWTLRAEPSMLLLCGCFVNSVAHGMEVRFVVTKKLVLNMGEIGPNEVEFIFSGIVIFGGLYSHNVFLNTLGATFGIQFLDGVTWRTCIAGLLMVLYMLMLLDSLSAALQQDFLRTLYYMLPLVYVVSLFLLHSQMAIF